MIGRFVLAIALSLCAACASEKRDAKGEKVTVGRLRLRTFPSGAKVWINGELKVESTPATLVLPEGEYVLVLQLAGAEALEKQIEIEAGDIRELDVNLPRPIDATITVFSDVVGAKVIVNGYTRGSTPVVKAVTKPGPIDVTVIGPAGHARQMRGTLAIAEQKVLELFFGDVWSELLPEAPPPPPQCLPPPSGKLTLGVEPEGEVFDAEDHSLGKTPLIEREMPVGEHRLLLRSADAKREKFVSVVIEDGKTAIYRFRLLPEDERN